MSDPFPRKLGLLNSTMIVMGNIIGAGIFLTPGIVAEKLGEPLYILGIWVVGGVFALAGAFAYAELGAMFPKAGGSYIYIRDSYGPLPGFLYGWVLLVAIGCGAVHIHRVYLSQGIPLWPFPSSSRCTGFFPVSSRARERR